MSDHRGVGVIVRNPTGSRFYLQQKDAEYPDYPLAYSLFGGACEPGETAIDALVRELDEELGDAAAIVMAGQPTMVLDQRLGASQFQFSMFEAVVGDAELDALDLAPVFEGERGVVVSREQLRTLEFVWDLGAVVRAYLLLIV